MNYRKLRDVLLAIVLTANVGNSSSAVAQGTGTSGFLSANAIAQSYFQQRLFEFVSPMYQQPLVSTSLLESLSKPGPGASREQILAADRIAYSGAAAAQVETQTRRLGLSLRQQLLQREGFKVGGISSTVQAAGLEAKASSLQARVQVLNAQLEYEKELHKYRLESRKERLAYVLEKIKRQANNGLTAKSGQMINVVLDSIKPTLLEYGYSIDATSDFRDEIKSLTINPEDIAKIQLQIEAEGQPIIFTADKGCTDLGRIPFVMNHPEIMPLIRDIETRIEVLSELEEGPEAYAKTIELGKALTNLETESERILGTAKENAQRGSREYRLWTLGKDYRAKIKGIVHRLELVGSPSFLKMTAKKYDPQANENGVLGFARFIAENGCRVAPAAQGDEATYIKFMSLLKRLEAILKS